MDTSHSVLLSKYLNIYQRNPNSRVFAPLGECYRQAGMLEDALQVLKNGLKSHPDYTLAYVVLAQCYCDQKKYLNSYNVLKSLSKKHVDNIKLQRIFAQTCIELEKFSESLNAYKYVLFFNPSDDEAKENILRLESREKTYNDSSSDDEVEALPTQETDWIAKQQGIETDEVAEASNENFSEWEMKKIAPEEKEEVKEALEVPAKVEGTNVKEKKVPEDIGIEDSPLMTHTMVDIYLAQQHYENALKLLERILDVNPKDIKSREKYDKVQRMLNGEGADQKKEKRKENYDVIEGAFLSFYEKIKERSKRS